MRWKGEYPRAPPPLATFVTQSFGVSSDRDALIHVLRTLWTWHTDLTGEGCPFNFAAEIV